jgi:hypothetical protein
MVDAVAFAHEPAPIFVEDDPRELILTKQLNHVPQFALRRPPLLCNN